MILATVGTQLPFTRLISALDAITPDLDEEVIAQIGDDPVTPANLDWRRTFEPSEFQALFLKADCIVSHAGMGTLLAARKFGKPIIIMPRRAAAGEHRNDHQLATTNQLKHHPGVYVAETEDELRALLTGPKLVAAPTATMGPATVQLVGGLKAFINRS